MPGPARPVTKRRYTFVVEMEVISADDHDAGAAGARAAARREVRGRLRPGEPWLTIGGDGTVRCVSVRPAPTTAPKE